MRYKIIPIFKYAGNSGDRLWWNEVQSGDSVFKVAYPLACTLTTWAEAPSIKMLKFFFGPVCIGVGWYRKCE